MCQLINYLDLKRQNGTPPFRPARGYDLISEPPTLHCPTSTGTKLAQPIHLADHGRSQLQLAYIATLLIVRSMPNGFLSAVEEIADNQTVVHNVY